MFENLDQIDWNYLGFPQLADWIRGLISDNPDLRIKYHSAIVNSYIHENAKAMRTIVPFMLTILEKKEVNTETGILIEQLRAFFFYAIDFIERNTSIDDAQDIISKIRNSKNIFEVLSKHPLTQETALRILNDIEVI